MDSSTVPASQQKPATAAKPEANPARQFDPRKAPTKAEDDTEKPFYIYETGGTDKIKNGTVDASAGGLPYFGITRNAFLRNKDVNGRYPSTHERWSNYESYRGILGQAPESIAYGVESALIALNTYGKDFEKKVLLNQHSSADVRKRTRIDNKMFSNKNRERIADGIVWLTVHFGADWKDKFLHKENKKGVNH